jgi:hypothetical protein
MELLEVNSCAAIAAIADYLPGLRWNLRLNAIHQVGNASAFSVTG